MADELNLDQNEAQMRTEPRLKESPHHFVFFRALNFFEAISRNCRNNFNFRHIPDFPKDKFILWNPPAQKLIVKHVCDFANPFFVLGFFATFYFIAYTSSLCQRTILVLKLWLVEEVQEGKHLKLPSMQWAKQNCLILYLRY